MKMIKETDQFALFGLKIWIMISTIVEKKITQKIYPK